MTDQPYRNRELDAKFDSVAQTSTDNADELKTKIQSLQNIVELRIADLSRNTADSLSRLEVKSASIEEQTKKTNGRVSKLENWQAYVIGFCAAISIILLPLLFMVARGYMKV